ARLEDRRLRAHQAEDDAFVFRHEPQRREIPGSCGIVLEEERVDAYLVEQSLGDRLVAARGHPVTAQVAATEVHADGHRRGPLRDRAIDGVDVSADEHIRILAAGANALAYLVV